MVGVNPGQLFRRNRKALFRQSRAGSGGAHLLRSASPYLLAYNPVEIPTQPQGVNAEGEQQAAEKLAEAGRLLAAEPQAMQLRNFAALHDIASERSSTIVFPLPTDLLAHLGGASERQAAAAPDPASSQGRGREAGVPSLGAKRA